jgi:predicted nucleic acid-binding protein
MKIIVDTGPLVAFLVRGDAWHDWAVNLWKELPPLWTCEAVLVEAAHLTNQAVTLMRMVSERLVRIGLNLEEQSGAISELLSRYGPRMDLADACVVRMSELFPDSKVLTLDRRDFSVYRRNKRNVIPLIAPAQA